MTMISKLELERMKDDAYERGKRDGAAEERERCCAAIQEEIDDCEKWIDTTRETESRRAARVYELQRIGLIEAQRAIHDLGDNNDT